MSARKRVTVKLLEDVENETTGDPLWSKDAVLKVDPGTAQVWTAEGVAEVVEAEKVEDVDVPEAVVTEDVPSGRRQRGGSSQVQVADPADTPADPAGGQ